MEKDVEYNIKKTIENLEKSVEQKQQQIEQQKKKKLEKEVIAIQKKQETEQDKLNKKREEFTELTFDVIFDLFKVADELLQNVAEGRVGQNLNGKLFQLYLRVVEYRKKMIKGLAVVENDKRLDAIQIRKDLKKNFQSNAVKMRSESLKNRLKKF
jgi:hypothetical protein